MEWRGANELTNLHKTKSYIIKTEQRHVTVALEYVPSWTIKGDGPLPAPVTVTDEDSRPSSAGARWRQKIHVRNRAGWTVLEWRLIRPLNTTMKTQKSRESGRYEMLAILKTLGHGGHFFNWRVSLAIHTQLWTYMFERTAVVCVYVCVSRI